MVLPENPILRWLTHKTKNLWVFKCLQNCMGRIAALQVGMQSSNFVQLSFSIIQITMKFHCWLSGFKA